MTKKSGRTRWICVAVLLPVLGCVDVVILEPDGDPNGDPNDWPVYYGPAGGTRTITFQADVYIEENAWEFVEFRANPDGHKTWWDADDLEVGWQTLTWVQEVDVEDGPKTFRVLYHPTPLHFEPEIIDAKFWVLPDPN